VAERVVVVGAGIAGLACALTLAPRGFEVTLLERDGVAPARDESPAEIARRRRGVPHAVHPHFFMGRLREALRAQHPELLARLAAAGTGEGTFAEALHPVARSAVALKPGDAALTSIAARRTTFERVLREYAEERGLARIESGVQVLGLLAASAPVPTVRGVRIQRATGERADELADVVIDASGRSGTLHRELGALGVQLAEERHDAGIFYFTRHYELLPGCEAPLSHGLPGFLYADFAAGALPSDRGAFTVTYQVQRDDPEMIAVVREPERFHALCTRIPTLARWVDPARSRPTSDVFGFGQMDAFWRGAVANGEPLVLGLHFAGDARVRSNPRYGRGCTWSYVSAELLARTLAETRDPRERALRYDAALERELRADWRTMLSMDRAARARFEVAAGRRSATLADRVRNALTEVIDEAQTADSEIFRGVWTGYHGLARMDAWLRSPRAWLRLARHAFARRERRLRLAERFMRPSRAEILTSPAGPSTAT
jgi:flavin-dependent dehydrogenase